MKVPMFIVGSDYFPKSTDSSTPLTVILKCRDLNGHRRNIHVRGCVPRFWTSKDPGPLHLPAYVTKAEKATVTTVTKEPLWEIRVKHPGHIPEIRDALYPHYSADVPYHAAVRWHYGWKAVIEIDDSLLREGKARNTDPDIVRPAHIKDSSVDISKFQLSTLWYDIETQDDIFHKPEDAGGRVISIAIYDQKRDRAECAIHTEVSQRQVRRMLGSSEALEALIEHDNGIPAMNAERITVKTISAPAGCDPMEEEIESEASLFHWFNRRLKEYDPDVIAGHNIRDYDNKYLKTRARRMNNEARRYGRRQLFPRMFSSRTWQYLDTFKAYKEQIEGLPIAAGGGSLGWMCSEELGYGKVPRNSILEMYEKDPALLVAYNIWDCVVPARVEKKMALLDFYQYKTGWHDSVLNNSHANMMLVEDMMAHLLREEDVVMPSLDVVRAGLEGLGFEGGFVADAPTGVFRWAFEIDNSMEYPACIISGNLDISTRIRNPETQYPDGYPFPVTITPSGRVYRRDIEGIMPRILRELATNRERIRTEMKSEDDPEKWALMNRQQRVLKENMNSWYGVLGSGGTSKTGSRPFRMSDPAIGADITEIARNHNAWNKKHTERTTLYLADSGVVLDEEPGSYPLHFEVIYQDTDSCKCVISNLAAVERDVRPLTIDDVRSCANILCHLLNDSFDDFVKQTLQIEKNEFFRIKPDAYYDRYFQWGAKKRYAYMDDAGVIGYRGVEIRRSNAPALIKEFQRRLLDSVLSGGSKTEANEIVRQFVKDTEEMDEEDFGKPMGLQTRNESTQQWKAALWSNKHLGSAFDVGSKPKLYYISSSINTGLPTSRIVAVEWGEKPSDIGLTVDRSHSVRRHVAESNSVKAMLSALGTSWDAALAGMSQTTMEDWFA
tara:strand:+ start:7895 stop:10573 length:2679 start_codon:yes stop_codon:yes gene_type:complete